MLHIFLSTKDDLVFQYEKRYTVTLIVLLEHIFKHMKEKQVTRNSQDKFTKGKTRLTNLIAFHDKTDGFVDVQKCVSAF